MFFLYYCYLLNNAITNIIDNEDFQNYVSYYKLLNAIYIDSYKNNKVNSLNADIQEVSDTSMSLRSIITTYYPLINNNYNIPSYTPNNNEILFSNNYLIFIDIITSITELKYDTSDASYVYLIYTANTYNLNTEIDLIDCDILVIGGGGSGGTRQGGGGGAGSLIYIRNKTLISGTYTISIGSGGSSVGDNNDRDSAIQYNGNQGGDTIIIKDNIKRIYIAKGGGGGGGGGTNKHGNGLAGGSSGGGSTYNSISHEPFTSDNIIDGVISTIPYGNIGGRGYGRPGDNYNEITGGGGGGSGSIGENGIGKNYDTNTAGKGGNGGSGTQITITGTSQYYAAGGGGGVHVEADSGGLGGSNIGGNGSKNSLISATSGAPNTGSGGGGGGGGENENAYNCPSGAGGSGVVIIRFNKKLLNNISIVKTSNTITFAKRSNNIIKKIEIKIDDNNKYNYLLIQVINNNEHYFIRNLINNVYYKYEKVYYRLDKTTLSSYDKNFYQYEYFIINIDNTNNIIDKNPKFYNDLIQYLRYKNNTATTQTATKINALATNLNSDYLNNFYNLIANIQTTVKNNENISIHDVNNFIDDVIQNRDILRYIDIYDTSYDFLKKYIFIKNNNKDPIYKSINDTYEKNKLKKVSMLRDETKIIQDVITKFSEPTAGSTTVDYYLIDIQTINSYFNNKKTNNDYSNIDDFIVNIYNKLIDYYNETYDLHIENFDILYKENKKIDANIKDRINIFNYLFNIIIATIIIIITIIMHVFFINIYYNY